MLPRIAAPSRPVSRLRPAVKEGTMTLKAAFVIVTSLAAGSAFADARHDHRYLQVELDVPGAASLGTSIYGINDDGVMVGNFANGDVVDAFVLKDGAFIDIVAPG